MLPIAGQTAGPIGLNFFVDNQGWPGSVIGYTKFDFFFNLFNIFIHGQRRDLHLVFLYNIDFNSHNLKTENL